MLKKKKRVKVGVVVFSNGAQQHIIMDTNPQSNLVVYTSINYKKLQISIMIIIAQIDSIKTEESQSVLYFTCNISNLMINL